MAEVRGSFFAPGCDLVVDAYCHKVQELIADRCEQRIHLLQKAYFKRPTGFYERHIATRDLGDHHLVHDSDVVYGPWLEGVGSRNFPVTRFKGYAIMRKTTQTVAREAIGIAEPHIARMCEVLNR